MTRDEKWGRVWAQLQRLYMLVRGDDGYSVLSHQENFSKEPAKVFRRLYEDIQSECAEQGVPDGPLLSAVADLDKSEFTSEPLGEFYLYGMAKESVRIKSGQSVGQRIAERRQAAGLTQAQLAEKIGVVQVVVSRWETGERNPKLDALKHIAEACGCLVDDLI